jgi:hypothetical protein
MVFELMTKFWRCHAILWPDLLVLAKIRGYRPVAIGRPRITSFFVQVCTAPQCAHVNFCVFTAAVCQRFSSIVFPVSVSFEVEGHRTSRLLILRPVFAFVRRGGSKKNLVAILESINNARCGRVVGRHLHFYPIPNRYSESTCESPRNSVCHLERADVPRADALR